MLYTKFWEEQNAKAINVINNMKIPLKEKQYRKKRMNDNLQNMISKNEVNVLYYSLLHEIKSYQFLKRFGDIKVANDCEHEKGADFKFKHYHIECVSCSSGESKEILNHYLTLSQFDYNKCLSYLYPRITSSLNEKSIKFKKYINDGIINEKDPCIIFLSLGDIEMNFILSNKMYGFDFLDILVSKGPQTLHIDENFKLKYKDYSYRNEIFKNNDINKPIPTNFFINQDNDHISAIIITTANFEDNYDESNTFLFLNPYATTKIKVKDFYSMFYWKMDKTRSYIPRKKGKYLWNKINH